MICYKRGALMYPRQNEECPVCFAKCKEDFAYIDQYYGPISEHYITCPNKCFSYEYAYGSTIVYVSIRDHHVMFGWHYTDDPQTIRNEGEAIDLMCEAARRAQLEDYWRIIHHEDQTKRPQESR